MKHLILIVVFLITVNTPVLASDCDSCDTAEVLAESYGLTAAAIEKLKAVELVHLEPNTKLMHDRWYARLNGTVAVHDAPHGNVTRIIEDGFNFVTVMAEQDGWTQINPNEWILSESASTSNYVISSFTGFFYPEGQLDYTLAWALVNMYPSKEPGGNPSEQFERIDRYDLLRIFATVEVDDIRWYQVAPDQWVHQHRVAKVLPLQQVPITVDTERWISIDLFEQVLIAYEGERPVFATLVSTGLPRWPTYEGTFNIYIRHQREFMSWGTVGDDFYSLEEVPWTMFFDAGRALHGAYWHDGFGYRRSHGCVNLSITDARWLYDWVAEVMGSRSSRVREQGPIVYVYSSDQYAD